MPTVQAAPFAADVEDPTSGDAELECLQRCEGAGEECAADFDFVSSAGVVRVRTRSDSATRGWASTVMRAAVVAASVGGVLWAGARQRSTAVPVEPARSSNLLLSDESMAAFERLNRMLADSNKIDVEEPGTPHDIDQTKLAYTQCVVDVVQAADYLGQAIIFIDKAVSYSGTQCPDMSRRGCAVQIEATVTALLWFASYISLTLSSCTATVNAPAACAADVTGIMANLGELATASTAASVDCKFETESHREGWRLSLGRRLAQPKNQTATSRELAAARRTAAHPLSALMSKLASDGDAQAKHDRKVDEALCALDVVHSVSYVIRATKQILGAAVDTCVDKKVCTLNIFNIISSVAWISQFVSLAAGDCAVAFNQAAYCSGDISDLVAATTNLVAILMAVEADCGSVPHKYWGGNTEIDMQQETK